jgi:hypothetical protein
MLISAQHNRKSYMPPAGGADRGAPRTPVRDFCTMGRPSSAAVAFSFFLLFLFLFHSCFFFILL